MWSNVTLVLVNILIICVILQWCVIETVDFMVAVKMACASVRRDGWQTNVINENVILGKLFIVPQTQEPVHRLLHGYLRYMNVFGTYIFNLLFK